MEHGYVGSWDHFGTQKLMFAFRRLCHSRLENQENPITSILNVRKLSLVWCGPVLIPPCVDLNSIKPFDSELTERNSTHQTMSWLLSELTVAKAPAKYNPKNRTGVLETRRKTREQTNLPRSIHRSLSSTNSSNRSYFSSPWLAYLWRKVQGACRRMSHISGCDVVAVRTPFKKSNKLDLYNIPLFIFQSHRSSRAANELGWDRAAGPGYKRSIVGLWGKHCPLCFWRYGVMTPPTQRPFKGSFHQHPRQFTCLWHT